MRNEECLEKIEWTVEHCGMRKDHADECIKAREFMKENTQFWGYSTVGLMPLIREQDSEIKQKIVTNALKLNDEDRLSRYGTERKMKAAINRYKDTNPEATKEIKEIKPKKLWNMLEQAEYTRQYVKVMIMNGAKPASIRELVVKAVGVVEQE